METDRPGGRRGTQDRERWTGRVRRFRVDKESRVTLDAGRKMTVDGDGAGDFCGARRGRRRRCARGARRGESRERGVFRNVAVDDARVRRIRGQGRAQSLPPGERIGEMALLVCLTRLEPQRLGVTRIQSERAVDGAARGPARAGPRAASSTR